MGTAWWVPVKTIFEIIFPRGLRAEWGRGYFSVIFLYLAGEDGSVFEAAYANDVAEGTLADFS